MTSALPDEAWRLLTEWLPGNDDPERPQITLSTVDEDGDPDARTVLLTSFGPDGFLFNTDGASRKAAHIAAHPAVAMTVLWPGFTHQLVIRGTAAPAPADRVAAAYRSRSPYLQQLAWLNTHEFAELPREERVAAWAAFEEAHAGVFEQPESWVGYLVTPTRLTFWSSNGDTASQRVEFARAADGSAWSRRYLAG
ncbi:pyridoxine/pyridoxamine 5'-phosphate oxidase [Frondihabitans peucedani]|uniref:Pyridoxal 5'-phosphate synthase n=1 Tax=Frondihabitans peucedani TaxID=598626 RepID=A0ABP8E5W8_9MICO